MISKETIVAPSILAADFSRLADEVHRVEQAGADWIHCDIMDGHFVDNISFGPEIVGIVRKETRLPLDVHLMIQSPDHYAPRFVKAGANSITVHVEREAFIKTMKSILGPEGVISEREQLRTYECDGLMNYRVIPDLVVLPESAGP